MKEVSSEKFNTVSQETLQSDINKGRQVVLREDEKLITVRIRYNNQDTDGTQRWRLLVFGSEFLTSEIIINTVSKTFSENFEKLGVKHHIVCQAKEIVFFKNIATIS